MTRINDRDLEIDGRDPRNTLELRSLRLLKARIKDLEEELSNLKFVYETLQRHTKNRSWE